VAFYYYFFGTHILLNGALLLQPLEGQLVHALHIVCILQPPLYVLLPLGACLQTPHGFLPTDNETKKNDVESVKIGIQKNGGKTKLNFRQNNFCHNF
jgi:hypothetical protein